MSSINKKVDRLIARRLEAYRDLSSSLSLSDHQKQLLNNSWVNAIEIMEKLRWKNYRYSMRSLGVLVVCSSLVPALINVETNNDALNTVLKIAATTLSITVTILTGLRQGYKWTEKWKHYHNSAEALKTEGEMFVGLAGVYGKFRTHATAFSTFIQNANAIKTEHLSEYIRSVSGGDQTNSVDPENGKEKKQTADRDAENATATDAAGKEPGTTESAKAAAVREGSGSSATGDSPAVMKPIDTPPE